MSGGKTNGVAHQVLDRLHKFEMQVSGKMSELVNKHNELAAAISAQEQVIKNIAGFTASEMGKAQGETARNLGMLARSVDGVDLNVLALAEMAKEVIGQLTQIDTVFKKFHEATKALLGNQYAGLNDDGQVRALEVKDIEAFKNVLELSEAEVSKVREDATTWYKNLVGSAFKTVQEKRAADEQAAIEAETKAKAEAEEAAKQTEAAQTEKQSVEAELKAASEAERSIVTNKSGGPGSEYPDGADVFGG